MGRGWLIGLSLSSHSVFFVILVDVFSSISRNLELRSVESLILRLFSQSSNGSWLVDQSLAISSFYTYSVHLLGDLEVSS